MIINTEIERISYSDERKEGYRMDRNEKVIDWDKNLFIDIFKNIKQSEFTSYPKNNYTELYCNVAKYLNVEKECIFFSNGADGIIRELFMMFNNEKNIGILEYTYGMYNVYPKIFNLNIIKIPYIIDFNNNTNICKLNKDYFYKNIKNIDILFIVNPNQISNNDFSTDEIEKLCQNYPKKKFVIDEAYFGYGHYSVINLTKIYNNIFVIRSFSKTFGLASMRLGVLIGNKHTIKPFNICSPIYSVNIYTSEVCNYFLNNIDIVNEYNDKVIEGREWFVEILRIHNYKIIDPKSLSIIVCFTDESICEKIYNKALENSFYIKKMNIQKYKTLRISCAPKDIMEKLYEICFKIDNINTEYCKYLYNKRGYFCIDNVYSLDEINEIIDIIKLIDFKKYIYTGYDEKNKLPFRLEYFTKNNSKLNKILYKEKYMNLLKICLNTDEISLYKDKFICKNAYSNKIVEPHVDGTFYTYNYRLKKNTWGWYTYASEFIQYGIFLTDNNEENGSIYFDNIRNYTIEDFHNKFIGKDSNNAFIKNDIMNSMDIFNTSKLITGKKGNIIIFNPKCIHYGYENTTSNPRINLYLTFNKSKEGNYYNESLNDKKLLLENIGIKNLEKRMKT